jgi:hypothetical protein
MTRPVIRPRRHASDFMGPPLNRSTVYLWERIRLGCKVCRECGEPWHWAVVERPGISPQINIVGQIMAIRRAVYILKHGKPPPKGKRATSTCPNQHCCDPEKVVARKISQMVSDTFTSGARDRARNRTHIARYNEANKLKLSDDAVRAIRASELPPEQEAALHNVHPDYITSIRNGRARMQTADLGVFSALVARSNKVERRP